MLNEWGKNSTGNIALTPLASIETAILYECAVGLRLELATNPDQPHTDLIVVQIGMNVEQTKDLIRVLQLRIDQILASRSEGPTH